MNAEQKKRIAHEISNWKNACNCRAVQLTGDRMAALLQELVDGYDAPEALAATNPSQISSFTEPGAWRHIIPGRRRTEKFGSPRAGDYNQVWNDCREATEKALNDLEKRK